MINGVLPNLYRNGLGTDTLMERTDFFASFYLSTVFHSSYQHVDYYRYMGVPGVISAS